VRTSALALVASVFVLSCAKPPPPAVGVSPIARPPASSSGPKNKGKGLVTTDVAAIDPGFQGPYVAAVGDRGLAVWGAEGGAWQVAKVTEGGATLAPAKAGPQVGKGLGLVVVRGLESGGFVMVLGRAIERGYSLEAIAFDDEGTARGAPAMLYQGATAISWTDVVSTPTGAHVYFASGTPSQIAVTALDARGAMRGPAVPVGGATTWQVVSTSRGSLLAQVIGQPGRVSTIAVDDAGKPGSPVPAGDARADADLDAVRVGDRVVLAWTDRTRAESRVLLVAVDASGAVVTPAQTPFVSAGEQALVGLAVSGDRPLVIWDDAASRLRDGRRLQLATMPPDLSPPLAQATIDLGVKDDTPPLIVGGKDGFAVLTVAKACGEAAATCQGAPPLPSYALLGLDLSVRRAGPVTLDAEDGAPPDLSWGLSCTSAGCFLAATGDRTPSHAYVVALEGGPPPGTRPFVRARRSTPPVAITIDTLAKGPKFAGLASTRLEQGGLLATVTDHGDGMPMPALPPDVDARGELEKDRLAQKDPKRSKRSAMVRVTALDASNKPLGDSTLSIRAMSAGGVAIAADKAKKEACVAWVARDEGDPELFLTRVGADGKKRAQTMLTHAKGDVGDPVLAAVDDGWIVAWVDFRDGNGEVYAVRVDRNLRKLGPEKRITTAPGDASDVALLVREKDVLIAFSDARGNPGGAGDAFVARLALADAAKQGDEIRLAQTAEHARGLRFVKAFGETAVVFLEQPIGAAAEGGKTTALAAFLDANGAPRGLPETISLGDASPSAFDLSCEAKTCRVALTRGDGEGLSLAAGSWVRGQPVVAPDVTTLLARAGSDAFPTLLGDSVLVLDENAGEGRVRRISIRW
jgi:hypothetical protein